VGKLLALDLSTTASGFALFDIETKALIHHGFLRPQKCGMKGVGYPLIQLKKMQSLAEQIQKLIDSIPDLKVIAIEEINRGVGRLSQKVLDGFHFILMDRIEHKISLVHYKDSDGRTGWRTELGLHLTETDKALNKKRRALNAKLSKGTKKLPIVNRKHLACKFVNKHYLLALDCDVRETDGDEADAIGLGHSCLHPSN
jgi:hypothetical protein